MPLLRLPTKFDGLFAVVLTLGGVALGFQEAHADDPEPPPIPPQVIPEPLSHEETGFRPIFDGKTLDSWDGDPAYWRVENGTIVGETTQNKHPKYHSFITWRGGRPRDFELMLEYRVSPMGNSGLQYRSAELPGFKWLLHGYQFDIDGREWGEMFYAKFAQSRGQDVRRVTGQNYDERGRTFLAFPGQLSYVGPGQTQRVVALVGESEALARVVSDDWNKVHLIVRGNLMIHILNDRVMSIVIADDTEHRQP